MMPTTESSMTQSRAMEHHEQVEEHLQKVDFDSALFRKNDQSGTTQPRAVRSLPKFYTNSMTRSASIPISNSIRRTSSETQLSQDEAEADYKDFLFYSRVVHGISRNQRHLQDGYLKYENQMCLQSIVHTRHADIHKKQDTEWEDQLTELGFIDGGQYNHHHHSDPAIAFHHESSDDGIFALDM